MKTIRDGAGPLGVAMAGLVAAGAPLSAARAQDFDLRRAAINDTAVFAPFLVTGTVPLSTARASGALADATPLLVFETPSGPLALVTAQMAYHHVAQGDIAGEPWMVSF